MQKKRLVVFLFFIVAIAVGGVLLLTRQAKPPVLVSRTDPPRISFEEETHDLGNVLEGTEIPYVFKIQNIGGEQLVIKNVSTSCGCTLLNLKTKYIEPGKSGDLEVIMDTSMKQGAVKKQIDIYSNDPEHPKVSVYLAANVLPGNDTLKLLPSDKPERLGASAPVSTTTAFNPHAGLTNSGRAKIFTGQCATCHVAQGKGKMGADLFQADCAMCHGQNAEGGVGPALIPGNYQDREFVNRIQKTIRYGSDDHPSMPGFLDAAGGPLTDGEINSIVNYLQNKSEQILSRPAEVPAGG